MLKVLAQIWALITRLGVTKTFWVALSAIISAIAAYATGQITLAACLQLIVTALLGITVRDAVAKTILTKGITADRRVP